MELLNLFSPYILFVAGWYAFVVYPIRWFRARYRVHFHRRHATRAA